MHARDIFSSPLLALVAASEYLDLPSPFSLATRLSIVALRSPTSLDGFRHAPVIPNLHPLNPSHRHRLFILRAHALTRTQPGAGGSKAGLLAIIARHKPWILQPRSLPSSCELLIFRSLLLASFPSLPLRTRALRGVTVLPDLISPPSFHSLPIPPTNWLAPSSLRTATRGPEFRLYHETLFHFFHPCPRLAMGDPALLIRVRHAGRAPHPPRPTSLWHAALYTLPSPQRVPGGDPISRPFSSVSPRPARGCRRANRRVNGQTAVSRLQPSHACRSPYIGLCLTQS